MFKYDSKGNLQVNDVDGLNRWLDFSLKNTNKLSLNNETVTKVIKKYNDINKVTLINKLKMYYNIYFANLSEFESAIEQKLNSANSFNQLLKELS